MKEILFLVIIVLFVSCQHSEIKYANSDGKQIANHFLPPKKVVLDKIDTINNKSSSIEPNENAVRSIQECKIELLTDLREKINNPSEELVNSFLKSFNKVCETNVEFSEGSNFLLFLLLQKQPELAIKVYTEDTNIDRSYIKKALENPISDGIDLHKTYSSVAGVRIYIAQKDSILKFLNTAIQKSK